MTLPTGPVTATFPLHVQLVTMDVVRALLGISTDAIQSAAESGKIRFAWNVSVKGSRAQISELRFWLREIVQPAAAANLSLSLVIASILGEHRSQWRGVEVSNLLMVSRPQIHRLQKSKALPGQVKCNTLWIGRAGLEKFLQDRCQKSF